MKRLSFITIILCMLTPPLCYIATLSYLEAYLQEKFKSEIEEIYIGDSGKLLKGSISLKNAVEANIRHYLEAGNLDFWGVVIDVSVVSKSGLLLYPNLYDSKEEGDYSLNPLKIASDNYKLLSEGLSVSLNLRIERYAALSVCILFFYIGLSLLVLYYYYRLNLKHVRRKEMEKDLEIERLSRLEKSYDNSLKKLEGKRNQLTAELSIIQQALDEEKRRASRNEEDLIDEIVKLEGKIKQKLDCLAEQEGEIAELEEKIARFEKDKGKVLKQKDKTAEITLRRFNTLYKNTVFNKRALSGFMDISEEFKIKAEEIIHQLNEDRNKVTVKRKVFGKKERETVFEVVFAYKGRLYYRVLKDSRIEIVSIGTKNTQTKDLAFLDNL